MCILLKKYRKSFLFHKFKNKIKPIREIQVHKLKEIVLKKKNPTGHSSFKLVEVPETSILIKHEYNKDNNETLKY